LTKPKKVNGFGRLQSIAYPHPRTYNAKRCLRNAVDILVACFTIG